VEFQKAVDEACDEAEKQPPVPTVEELKQQFFHRGGWDGVVQDQLHHMRSHLTEKLASVLDPRLHQMAGGARTEMFKRLLAEPLARILPKSVQDDSDPGHRVKAFRQLLGGKAPKLAAGLDYLVSFTFSYQSHLHYRVRREMEPLDPMEATGKGKVALPPGQDEIAADVGTRLTERYRHAVANVRKTLKDACQYDPLEAVFAVLEETRDRLVRARHIDREWRVLLYLHRGDVWPKEFSRFAMESARRQEWQTVLEAVTRSAASLRTSLPAGVSAS
jgi:hypothetical protein